MKTKISKGQEKYIIKIINLTKQEERVRILNLVNECPYLKKRDWIRAWLIKRITLKSANQNHSQQPEVLTYQGEGEHTGVSKKTTGGLESGKSKQYPSADITDKVEGAK